MHKYCLISMHKYCLHDYSYAISVSHNHKGALMALFLLLFESVCSFICCIACRYK